MIVAESYEACDDALGCWVFRGCWPDLTADEVRAFVLKHLVEAELQSWANVRNDHPESFFLNNARIRFKRDWRVRRVATATVLPVRT